MFKLLLPFVWSRKMEDVADCLRSRVKPIAGSVVYCDLFLGYMEHSGIYIGNGEIVHLTGKGNIEKTNLAGFVQNTTARNIFVSANQTAAAGSDIVAQRAISAIGKQRDYHLLNDNCHQFSSGCLSGNFENDHHFLWTLKQEAQQTLPCQCWKMWDLK